MTIREINKKYDTFVAVFNSNGVEIKRTFQYDTFIPVRNECVDELKSRFEKSYGRGDHSVKLYCAHVFYGEYDKHGIMDPRDRNVIMDEILWEL